MMGMFQSPALLVFAVLLPVVVVALVLLAASRRIERLKRLAESALLRRLLPAGQADSTGIRAARLGAAALLAGIAVAGPSWGTSEASVSGTGVDMVIAMDASLSMLATDERPSRLERMRQEVYRLRSSARGDRIGIIAFAGRSYILTPLTSDEGALDLFLENVDPSIVGQAGSAVSRAISQGTDLLLASQSSSDKALVVMSDWESHEGEEEIMAAAARAREAGITLIAVGFGSAQGSRIPIETNGRITYKVDEGGNVVRTVYNAALMREVARTGGGVGIDADETDKAARIRRALAGLTAERRASTLGEEGIPRFQLFLLPALLLVLLDTLRMEWRGRMLRRESKPVAGRRAATATLAVLLWPQAVGVSIRDRAGGEFQNGRYGEAIAEYGRRIDNGDESEATLYNYGTALLEADSLRAAAEVFGRLARSEDAEIRYRAAFNLGLARLRQGIAGGGGSENAGALDAAIEAYRDVLLMRAGDADAKWNYELALREKDSGGGGGGGSEQQQSAPESQGASQPQEMPAGIERQQAEAILDNAARDERDVQARAQDRNRPARPPGGKDW